MNETLPYVVNSPCIDKPQPGDPPNIPTDAEGLRAEQTAWLAVRDAWDAFLAKLFPHTDPASFGWMITNEREIGFAPLSRTSSAIAAACLRSPSSLCSPATSLASLPISSMPPSSQSTRPSSHSTRPMPKPSPTTESDNFSNAIDAQSSPVS